MSSLPKTHSTRQPAGRPRAAASGFAVFGSGTIGLAITVLGLLAVSSPAHAQPAEPSQLRAAALSEERVRLRWQDNACDESSFILQIESDDQAWRNVPFALEPDTSAVILSGLQPSTTYRFRILAANSDGFSVPSGIAEVRTFAAEPSCLVTPHRLCLMDGRYAVTTIFESEHFTGARHAAHAVPDGPRTGSFWFFDSRNLEISVEMIDGSGINGHIWVNAGGLSNLEYRVRVVDTVTGESRDYVHPTDDLCGISDRRAFLTPLASTAPPVKAEPDPISQRLPRLRIEKDPFRPSWQPMKLGCREAEDSQLSLLGRRFQLSLRWRDDDGTVHEAMPRYDSDNTGFFVTGEPDLADWAVKILDGRFFNQHFWLFWTPLSGRESWLQVTDTWTGKERRVYQARGASCGHVDTVAFEGVSN